MGLNYSTVLSGGAVPNFNDSPPADDGSEVASNRASYQTLVDELAAPLHSAIIDIDEKLLAALNVASVEKTTTYTTVTSDHATTLECNGTFTLSLLNPTGNGGYIVGVKNAGSGTVTVDVDGGANIDGSSSIALAQYAGRVFKVNADADAYSIVGSAADGSAITQGKHVLPINASGMYAPVSNGASFPTTYETTAGRPDIYGSQFSSSADQHLQFHFPAPESFNEGTITYRPYWTHVDAGTAWGVRWVLSAVGCGDGDTIDVTYGTGVNVDDTGGTAEDQYIGDESGALTIKNVAQGDMLYFDVMLDVSESTIDVDPILQSIKLYLTINEGNDG